MWHHGTRATPPKQIPALRSLTRQTFDEAIELNDKARALAPTEDVRQAIHTELAAIYTRWKAEVLADAGTFERALQRNCETLVMIVEQEQRRREDVETFKLIAETMAQQMELLITLKGEAPSPEDELAARLTAAHETVETTRPPTPKS